MHKTIFNVFKSLEGAGGAHIPNPQSLIYYFGMPGIP